LRRPLLTIWDETLGTLVGDQILLAHRPLARLVGLLDHQTLSPGQGMLLLPCTSVHTLGMRMAIDVVFLRLAGPRRGEVLRIAGRVRPWRLALGQRGTQAVLELPCGQAQARGVLPGHVLTWHLQPGRVGR
jgi:uncharacterized membrane protein (UPF0127 family)